MDITTDLTRLSSLERSLCTNFTCCSLVLPDMHALFQHYATSEAHDHLPLRLRIPVAPTPPLSYSPYSPLSSPPSTPPLSPALTDDDADEFIPSDELEYPTYEQCYRTFSKSLSSNIPPAPPPEPVSIAYSPMSSAPTSRSSSPCPLPSSRRTRNQNQLRKRSKKPLKHSFSPPMTSEPAPILGGAKGRTKISTKSKKGFGHVLGIGASKTQAQEKTSPVSGNGRRKNFVCPTRGCTKSYLNPNGLKYHLEKGTCDIRIEYEDEAMMEENVQPAASVVVDEEEMTQSESDSQIQAHVPPSSPPDSAPSSPQRSREHSLLHEIQLQPSQHPYQSQHQQTSSWYPDYADSDSESLSDIDTQSVVEIHMDVDADVLDVDVVGESE